MPKRPKASSNLRKPGLPKGNTRSLLISLWLIASHSRSGCPYPNLPSRLAATLLRVWMEELNLASGPGRERDLGTSRILLKLQALGALIGFACQLWTTSTKPYRARREETTHAWPLLPFARKVTHTHTHEAVLSSGLDIKNPKLLQLFWWGNSATKAQPWKGVIFWQEGLWRRGWDIKVTYRQPKKIIEKLKDKTKSDNVQKLNYLCYKIKRWWSMASGRNRHFTTKFSSI